MALARRLASGLARLGAVGVVAAFGVARVPAWPLTLFEHFHVQYAAVGLLVVAACVALRLRGWFDVAAIATLAHLCWLAPDLMAARRPLPAGGASVRVLLLNVHTSSTTHARVSQLIADTNPDVVALVEVDTRWIAALAPALAGYPARLEHPQTDNFGVALYTRGAFQGRIESLGTFPSIVGTLTHEGASLDVILTHPIPPVGGALVARHTEQLAAVAARSRELGPQRLVLGDLNATPWSRAFRELVAASGLCDSRAGFGVQATFPASSSIVRIPIDHALVSCDIGVRDRRVERDVGSDHLPVVLDLIIP